MMALSSFCSFASSYFIFSISSFFPFFPLSPLLFPLSFIISYPPPFLLLFILLLSPSSYSSHSLYTVFIRVIIHSFKTLLESRPKGMALGALGGCAAREEGARVRRTLQFGKFICSQGSESSA